MRFGSRFGSQYEVHLVFVWGLFGALGFSFINPQISRGGKANGEQNLHYPLISQFQLLHLTTSDSHSSEDPPPENGLGN